MKTAILFRTHKKNELALSHLQALRDTGLPVYVAYDASHSVDLFKDAFNFTNQMLLENDYQNATQAQLDKLPAYAKDLLSPNVYFNIEQVVMMWYYSQPEFAKYDYIWSIEYDVAFSGNWQHFFHNMMKDDSDFLGGYLMKAPAPHFYTGYWDTYQTEVPEENKYTSFGCIHRYSRELLKFADVACREGFHGFYEQVMPTIASIYGLKFKDINVAAQDVGYDANFYHPFTFGGICHKLIENYKNEKAWENHLFHPVRTVCQN